MGPVATIKLLFVETGDRAHASPGGGIGWPGEDHAVVKEDCFYLSHGCMIIVSGLPPQRDCPLALPSPGAILFPRKVACLQRSSILLLIATALWPWPIGESREPV